MKKLQIVCLAALVLILLTGCIAGTNELTNSADAKGRIAGFWQGLLNGFISPVTFIISLFNKNVQMYEVHNNGSLYNLGFLLGAMIIFGGGGRGARVRKPRRWKDSE